MRDKGIYLFMAVAVVGPDEESYGQNRRAVSLVVRAN
ncbi:hypothetical protein QFZ54_000325 [Sphingomonas faeni]|nr:hypothetical protein [Sphingomonas faeni]